MEVRTTTAGSSNNLFENVKDRSIEIEFEWVNESHDANKSRWYDDDSPAADDDDDDDALETI